MPINRLTCSSTSHLIPTRLVHSLIGEMDQHAKSVKAVSVPITTGMIGAVALRRKPDQPTANAAQNQTASASTTIAPGCFLRAGIGMKPLFIGGPNSAQRR